MKSKSPSHYDGKPIGTPTEAKSPFHAGVTTGPDQIERMEEMRRLRNRLAKAGEKAAKKAARAALSPEARERGWLEYKRRRNRADNMIRALRKGTKVDAVAQWWRITPDMVLAEVKWLAEHRNRARRKRDSKTPNGLPPRNLENPL